MRDTVTFSDDSCRTVRLKQKSERDILNFGGSVVQLNSLETLKVRCSKTCCIFHNVIETGDRNKITCTSVTFTSAASLETSGTIHVPEMFCLHVIATRGPILRLHVKYLFY